MKAYMSPYYAILVAPGYYVHFNMAVKGVAVPEDWCRASQALWLVDQQGKKGLLGMRGRGDA